MKQKIKLIAGIIFIIGGVSSLFQGLFFSAIFFLIAGLICLPITLEYLENKINHKINTPIKYILVIGFWIAGALLYPKSKTEKEIPKNEKENVTKSSPAEDKGKLLKEILIGDLETVKNPFKDIKYASTASSEVEYSYFVDFSNDIKDGEKSTDSELKKLASDLKEKVILLQIKSFPAMRKRYANALSKELWEKDINVTFEGSNNTIINFTGGLYAANKNIQESQELFNEILTKLRFKEVRYRWYKGAEEFTFYKLEVPKDNALAE